VDFGLCEANAICMGIAPEVFLLDEQDCLHILDDQEAARQCPRQAISIVG